MEGQEEKFEPTTEISDAEWEAALASQATDDDVSHETIEEEVPAESDNADSEPSTEPEPELPSGLSADVWGALSPEAQRSIAGTMESFDLRHRQELDRQTEQIQDFRSQYAGALKALNTLGEVVKATVGKAPEPKDDLPPEPNQDDLDSGDPRAMRQWYDAKMARERAQFKKEQDTLIAGLRQEVEDKIAGKIAAGEQQRDQAENVRAVEAFKTKYPDWEKHQNGIAAYLIQADHAENQKPSGKTRSEHLEAAIVFSREQEEFRTWKQARTRAKGVPNAGSRASERSIAPPPKNSTTIAEAFEQAEAELKRAGKSLDGLFV